jgi:cytochrome c556
MRVSLKMVICGLVILAMGGLAYAGFSKPGDAIRYRKAVMTVIGQHFGRIAAVVKGQMDYDKKDVVHNAMVIRTMSDLAWDAVMFPGSDMGDTTLKASAMKEKDKFMGIAKKFESAAQKLVDTAEKGDLAAVKAQFGAVAGNCKSCHGTFRKK